MQRVSQRIHLHIPRYNWVGFYLIDTKDSSTLLLGPYAGSFTPSPKISWNHGLCGSAAAIRRIIAADNFADDARYVQASDLVRSQICAPLVARDRIIGVFNVESYFLSTFKATVEREFVENCARLVTRTLERTAVPDLVKV